MKNLLVVALALLVSCATVKPKLEAFKDGAVACLEEAEPAAKGLAFELVTLVAADLIAGKGLDAAFDDATARAELGVKEQGLPVAACAFDGAIADLEAFLHPVPPIGEVPAFAARESGQLDAGRRALDRFEAAHGVKFVTR